MSKKKENNIDPELDIIELLNTKKQNTEILSITNAAVDALSNHGHIKAQSAVASEERSKENVFNDSSFSGKHKVRVSSRLLREIQMPTSEEITHDTSPNLFTSSSSSSQSSIQASGPIPTVIKYSSEPMVDTIVNRPHKHHTSPMVIKHHAPSNIIHSTTISDDGIEETSSTVPETPIPCQIDDNSSTDNITVKVTPKSPIFVSGKPQDVVVTTLYQGAPSTNAMLVMPESEKGQVKAMSFSGSSKGKAAKEILSKKQQGKASLRRVVQPKLVTTKPMQNTVNTTTTSDTTTTQISNTIEQRIGDLMTALGVIETKCDENRNWQLQQQQTLEQSVKERDERRLQHLEDMQKQLLEFQLKNVSTIMHPTMPYQVPYNVPTYGVTTGIAPQSTITQKKVPFTDEPYITTTTVTSNQQSTMKLPEVATQSTTGQVPLVKPTVEHGETLMTHSQHSKRLPQYNMADKHQTPSSFKTSVYNKPHVTSTGLKRKFVRNTRTQTSPQYSTSSSEMSLSPLETPLPRKRPPVPISRMSKNEGGTTDKHVHFDTPRKEQADESSQMRIVPAVDPPITIPATTRCSYKSPTKTTSSDYIVNDIGKLRQELKDALKETEQTKLSLRNLHDNIHSQISDNEDILIAPDHSQPYPLDAYLRATRDIPEESDSLKSEDIIPSADKGEKSAVSTHYNDALCILRDVQKQKQMLETNLLSLTRKHDEQHLYKLVDELTNETTNNETMRIRKEVAKKIEEISDVVKSELKEEEERKEKLNKENTEKGVEKKKNIGTMRSGLPLSTERRAKLRNNSKENQQRNKTNIKPKQITKPVTKAPTLKQPSTKQDVSYTSRVYGRGDHMPRRTTVKPSYTQRQSPVKTTPVAVMKENNSFHDSSTTTTTSSDDSSVLHPTHFVKHKPKYYFQPSEMTVKPAKSKYITTPLHGELLSMAIPLGKPKTDPALRLPLHLTQETEHAVSTVNPVVKTLIKQPNVAVVSIKDHHSMIDKQPDGEKKAIEIKEKRSLEKQVLPNVDINTSTSMSDISEISPSPKNVGPRIIPCPEPRYRPGASEYEEFKDYEAVHDVHELVDQEEQTAASETSVISLHGSKPLQSSYQGPAFPPRHLPPSTHQPDNLYTTKTIGETLEEKALEWVEKELLARVVSEISPTRPDPTCVKESVSSLTSDISNTEPDLLATVGQRGIQLFVDAGIPVDNELIYNLIVDVLKEKVANVIGYPKPTKQESSLSSVQDEKRAEDDYSDDLESLSEEQSRVETPVQTPSTDNHVVPSGSGSYIATPEESTISALSDTLPPDEHFKKMQSENMDNTMEEGRLEESDYGTPMATPLATPIPSPRTTPPAVVTTPEVSEQEQLASIKSGVETPEMTESVRETITEESPEVLKEQTYVDSGSDNEVIATSSSPTHVVEHPQPKQDYTNSPSSITTTTTTTHSTLGTVATEDEISEGEQLQPYVHVGQYSEGEFVAPAAMISGIGHMTTMHEVPDDIFDDTPQVTGSKQRDVFKQAVVGLLKNDVNEDSETTSNIDDISRSEGELDVVSALLHKIRQLPKRTPRKRMVPPEDQPATEQDTDSAGELLQPHKNTVWRTLAKAESASELSPSVWRTLPRMVSGGDTSPGEVHRTNELMVPREDDTLNRPQGSSVFDSDENNNTSDCNSTDPKSDTMKPPMSNTTPQVSSTPTQVPRVVKVMPAQESDSSISKLSAGESSPGTKFTIPGFTSPGKEGGDVTIETVSDYEETGLLEEVKDAPQRIELKLPSNSELLDESPSLSEGPMTFEYDDTVGDIMGDTSLSGGELP